VELTDMASPEVVQSLTSETPKKKTYLFGLGHCSLRC
jgi:hypothetical protein